MPPTTERGSTAPSHRVGTLSSLAAKTGWRTSGIRTQVRVQAFGGAPFSEGFPQFSVFGPPQATRWQSTLSSATPRPSTGSPSTRLKTWWPSAPSARASPSTCTSTIAKVTVMSSCASHLSALLRLWAAVLRLPCALSRSVSAGDAQRKNGVGGQQVGFSGRQELQEHAKPRHARRLRPGSVCPDDKTRNQNAERQGAARFRTRKCAPSFCLSAWVNRHSARLPNLLFFISTCPRSPIEGLQHPDTSLSQVVQAFSLQSLFVA